MSSMSTTLSEYILTGCTWGIFAEVEDNKVVTLTVVLKDEIMTVFVEVEDNEVVTLTVVLKDKVMTVFVEAEDNKVVAFIGCTEG